MARRPWPVDRDGDAKDIRDVYVRNVDAWNGCVATDADALSGFKFMRDPRASLGMVFPQSEQMDAE